MILFKTLRALLLPGLLRLSFGGSSESAQTTTNTDGRVVGGESSINSSQTVTGSENVITTTDHGAVGGSLQLAMRGVEGAQTIARETIAAQGGLLQGALQMAGAQNKQTIQALQDVKTADVRTLVIAGMAVVGLAAVTLLKRG